MVCFNIFHLRTHDTFFLQCTQVLQNVADFWTVMLNYPSVLLHLTCIIQPGARLSSGSSYTLITLEMTEIPARQSASHPTGNLSVIFG